MTRASRLALALVALAAAPAAAQSVRDFQLPPNPTPTPSPDVIGPVDPGTRPPATQPQPQPTPAPTTSPAPQPTGTPAAQPGVRAGEIVQPIPTSTPRSEPAARRTAAPTATATPAPAGEDAPPEQVEGFEAPPPPAPAQPAPARAEGIDGFGEDSGAAWPWWLALPAALLLAAGAAFIFRRRKQALQPPPIEKPVVKSSEAAPIAAAIRDALTLKAEALRMSRSVMAMTLTYRVTVLNRSSEALRELAIEADMGSASAAMPAEQQIASPAQALDVRHSAPRLGPGQTLRFEGQLRLPLTEAGLIRQGQTALLVPLLKLRATALGMEPVASTHVVGLPGEGGSTRLKPFQLDLPAGGYEPLAIRKLD